MAAPEVESGRQQPREGEKTVPEVAPKTAKEEAPEAPGATVSFFNHLFASVNLKVLFCREAILDP